MSGSARGAPLIFSVLPSRAVGMLACRPRNEGASEPREWLVWASWSDERRSFSGDRRTFRTHSDAKGHRTAAARPAAQRGRIPCERPDRVPEKSQSVSATAASGVSVHRGAAGDTVSLRPALRPASSHRRPSAVRRPNGLVAGDAAAAMPRTGRASHPPTPVPAPPVHSVLQAVIQ